MSRINRRWRVAGPYAARRPAALGALLLGLVACSSSQPNSEMGQLYSAAWFFGSGERDRVARLRLLRDSLNNEITKSCLENASFVDLERRYGANLRTHLRELAEGRVLRVQNDECSLTFPVFLDQRRHDLGLLARAVAADLETTVARSADALRAANVDGPMLFHVLWSRVIDEAWEEAWKRSGLEGSLQAVAWVLYPAHRFAVGTNYGPLPGNGSLAVTWSPQFTSHLAPLFDASWQLTRLAWGERPGNDSVANTLREFGLVDSAGQRRLLAYPISSALDHVLDSLVVEYAKVAARACDWVVQARRFDIHPGDLFVVLLHEAAYEVFERLHDAGTLSVPRLLRGEHDRSQTARLVSVATADPPGPFDEAMAVFLKAGGHGSPEIVDLFRRALAEHPSDVSGQFYLGLSLYDLHRYQEAIDAFVHLDSLTRGDTTQLRMHDWARIWVGHSYDARGERSAAIAAYEEVLQRDHDSGQMTMAQYGIGPITARAWARLRIRTPFEPR